MRYPKEGNGRAALSAPGRQDSPVVSVLAVAGGEEIVQRIRRSLDEHTAVIERAPTVDVAEELRRRMHFDLIVAELDEPYTQVTSWIGSMRLLGDRTPIILQADAPESEALLAALRAGASDFVVKHAEDAELAAAVRRVLWQDPATRDGQVSSAHGDVFESDGIVGVSDAMLGLCEVVRRVAPMPTTVLIQGESGTGKELVARAIHRLSGRTGNFAAINCGAISPELFESELFGHTKGSFTGALQARAGLMSYADAGTVFLDEIAEMPLPMQAKLLRVLEERTIRPVGSNREVPVDIRIVAATNHELALRVEQGAFREDLYHRLNVVGLRVPPLRERGDDISALGRFFLDGFSAKMGVRPPDVSDAEWLRLRQYSWPGNVRELRNIIERCVLLDRLPSACLDSGDLSAVIAGGESDVDDLRLEAVERRHILAVVQLAGGNKSEAARRLAISRKTLERKLRKWEME